MESLIIEHFPCKIQKTFGTDEKFEIVPLLLRVLYWKISSLSEGKDNGATLAKQGELHESDYLG
ncbi:MAG: hypothetical protein D3923_03315 [Candidatus Electrothrix sp. AR3]|nr:hypothetical protein [Candidatus Electrothrix sp. AR3]